jgi:hypothetical protein
MKIFRLYFLLLVISACNSPEGKHYPGTATAHRDTLAMQQTITPPEIKDSVHLRDIELSEKTVSTKKYRSKLDRAAQKKYSIRQLDTLESDGFNYYIYDSLYTGKKLKVLLISRTWPEENIIWIALYDDSMQLTGFEQVYYDNSEGALSIETSIKNDRIKITTDNSYEENANSKKTMSWYIDPVNKLVKQ